MAQDAGMVNDVSIPPGSNFDRAEFRLWLPEGVQRVRATVLLVPGSNGDGRPMVQDSLWQAFARKHQTALVGVRMTDKQHEQSFIEEYVDVSRGSGQALLDALAQLGKESQHAELADAPLMLWGMSAGGQFNYEFAAWKPERVIAFVVNKGGIYYSALLSKAARDVPGLLFTGETDLAFRTETIVGLFSVNRRGGALWALTQEPGTAHTIARSKEFGAIFFEEVLPLRLGAPGAPPIALDPAAGFIGNLNDASFAPQGSARAPSVPTAWLPTERAARAWQAVLTGKPFE